MIGILYILKLIVFIICAGVVLSVLFFVPLTIYVIPYCLWIGSQNLVGKHLDKKKEGVLKSTKHATILYKSWILRKEPVF